MKKIKLIFHRWTLTFDKILSELAWRKIFGGLVQKLRCVKGLESRLASYGWSFCKKVLGNDRKKSNFVQFQFFSFETDLFRPKNCYWNFPTHLAPTIFTIPTQQAVIYARPPHFHLKTIFPSLFCFIFYFMFSRYKLITSLII